MNSGNVQRLLQEALIGIVERSDSNLRLILEVIEKIIISVQCNSAKVIGPKTIGRALKDWLDGNQIYSFDFEDNDYVN